jgi:hypothetical protein
MIIEKKLISMKIMKKILIRRTKYLMMKIIMMRMRMKRR